jgi:RNA polymerase sigma-70 factor, ECF subfamily
MDRDVNLIEATLSGDKSAFGTLVSLYQKKVYRFVYRIIDNSSDASDIVQETFVNAYQNLEHLKDRDKFSLWLYQIAKNRCVDWIRKRQSNLLAIEDELSQERLYLPPAPDEILIEQETYQHIMRIIAKLPERRRRAVEMFYLEGRSYSEIQDELGITKGTLGRWLYKARLELRRNSKQFISAVTFWLNDGIYDLSKLVSKGIVTNVSTISVAKCLVISMMVHLMIFAQLSGNGISNNKNGISYPNPAIQADLLDQAKLNHIFSDSQMTKNSGSKFSGMNDPVKRPQISKILDKRVILPYIPYDSGKSKKSLNSISNTKSLVPDYQPKYTLNIQRL